MEEIKKLISQGIALTVCAISEDMREEKLSPKKNIIRARAIKLLVEAYKKVSE